MAVTPLAGETRRPGRRTPTTWRLDSGAPHVARWARQCYEKGHGGKRVVADVEANASATPCLRRRAPARRARRRRRYRAVWLALFLLRGSGAVGHGSVPRECAEPRRDLPNPGLSCRPRGLLRDRHAAVGTEWRRIRRPDRTLGGHRRRRSCQIVRPASRRGKLENAGIRALARVSTVSAARPRTIDGLADMSR